MLNSTNHNPFSRSNLTILLFAMRDTLEIRYPGHISTAIDAFRSVGVRVIPRPVTLYQRMSYPFLPPSGPGGLSKVPIPRLHQQRSENPRKVIVNRQNRVNRACLTCRSRKIKCNGFQPRCSNCSGNATPCVYASSRKNRLKTFVDHVLNFILTTEQCRATLQNQEMIALLQDLRQQVSRGGQDRIDDLLASVGVTRRTGGHLADRRRLLTMLLMPQLPFNNIQLMNTKS